jgi:hypothetical protein
MFISIETNPSTQMPRGIRVAAGPCVDPHDVGTKAIGATLSARTIGVAVERE